MDQASEDYIENPPGDSNERFHERWRTESYLFEGEKISSQEGTRSLSQQW